LVKGKYKGIALVVMALHILGDAKQSHQLTGFFSGELPLAIADHCSQKVSLHISHYKSIADLNRFFLTPSL
jgi:hypothetical protein